MIKIDVKQEALKSITDGKTEILQLNLGIELTSDIGEPGATTELRKEVAATITGLINLMATAKTCSRGELEILAEFLPADDSKPYRRSNMVFGIGIPDFEWSKGKGETPRL